MHFDCFSSPSLNLTGHIWFSCYFHVSQWKQSEECRTNRHRELRNESSSAVRCSAEVTPVHHGRCGRSDLSSEVLQVLFTRTAAHHRKHITYPCLNRSSFAIHVNFVNPQRSMSLAVVFLPLSTQRKSNNCKVAAQSSRPSHKNRPHRDYVNVQYFPTYLLCPLNKCLL